MKKQAFLYLGIWLSFFNIVSFSMQLEVDSLKMKGKEKKELTPEQIETLWERDSFNDGHFHFSGYKEIAPIVDEKKKKAMNNFIHSMVIGGAQDTEKDIAQENADFLTSIQEYSLEGQYEEMPFILFHGPHGTGKTTIASRFAQLLNKKTKRFLLDNITGKNNEVIQHVMKEYIEKIITEDGEPSVIFLDEIDKILPQPDPNDSNQTSLAQSLEHCLSEAQRINREKNQQKYFVLATTKAFPEKFLTIQSFFKYIEIGNPNFEKRIEILRDFISYERLSFDISTLDQSTIENIAKRFKGISIRKLCRLIEDATFEAQREYHESNSSCQDSNIIKPPLCERHFISMSKMLDKSLEQQSKEPETQLDTPYLIDRPLNNLKDKAKNVCQIKPCTLISLGVGTFIALGAAWMEYSAITEELQ